MKFLEPYLSQPRLRAYFDHCASELEALELYLWNLAISESLYVPLQHLEVCLRNRLHNALATKYSREDWYDVGFLLAAQQKKLVKAKSMLTESRKPHEPNRIVAELDFGFWNGLFNKPYERIIWQGGDLMRQIFPSAPRYARSTRFISSELNGIRGLRNRVFHHEPIWYMPNLANQYKLIMDILGWMSPEMLKLTRTIDRFSMLYAGGTKQFHIAAVHVLGES